MSKLIKYSLTGLKELSITQVVYGISKNMFNFVIWLINLFKKVFMLLRLGLQLVIAFLYKSSTNKL